MRATFENLRNLLGKRGVKFSVPAYQRGYEWETKHFQDLWSDLQLIGDRVNTHYLGNIILLEEDSNRFEIVDGQQRLATVSILMMAIRDAPNVENPDARRITDILNVYPSNSTGAQRRLYMSDDECDSSYEAIWSGNVDDADGNIKSAYKFFVQKTTSKSEDELNRLIKDINQNLQVVRTVAHDAGLAYMIFQSQNERGKEVEPEILAKARIHGAAERLDEGRREAIGRWDEMYRMFERELNPPRFNQNQQIRRPLRQILISSDFQTPTQIDKSELYRYFSQALQNHDDVLEFVKWFDERSMEYISVSSSKASINGGNFHGDIVQHIEYLNAATTHAELLSLVILDEVGDKHRLEEYFRLASVLAMRMELAGLRSKEQKDVIHNAAKEIKNTEDTRDIRAILADKIASSPTDQEIIEHLKANKLNPGGPWKFRALMKLVSIEESRRGPIRLDRSDLIIEHIAPKRSFDKPEYNEWRRGLDENTFVQDQHRNLIGNLTLLEPSVHSQIDETSFRNKSRVYMNSDIGITQEIAEYNQWTSDEIIERTEILAKELTNRWSM